MHDTLALALSAAIVPAPAAAKVWVGHLRNITTAAPILNETLPLHSTLHWTLLASKIKRCAYMYMYQIATRTCVCKAHYVGRIGGVNGHFVHAYRLPWHLYFVVAVALYTLSTFFHFSIFPFYTLGYFLIANLAAIATVDVDVAAVFVFNICIYVHRCA